MERESNPGGDSPEVDLVQLLFRIAEGCYKSSWPVCGSLRYAPLSLAITMAAVLAAAIS